MNVKEKGKKGEEEEEEEEEKYKAEISKFLEIVISC